MIREKLNQLHVITDDPRFHCRYQRGYTGPFLSNFYGYIKLFFENFEQTTYRSELMLKTSRELYS